MAFFNRSIRCAAGVALLAGMIAAGAAHAEAEYKWKMATGWTGGPLMDLGAKAFAKNVNDLTDGRIEVEVFPAGTLGKGLDVSNTVSKGIAELGHTWMGYDWGKDKATVAFGGFAGSMDSEKMLHWLYEANGIDLWREFREERFGLVSFPLFIRPAEAFLHSRKPVKTLEDLNGLKLRTAGAWLEISSKLGAAPVTMPGGEVYTSLERGVLDATEWGTLWENITPGFYQIAKYVIIPGVHQPVAPFELVINKDAFAELSEFDQEMVELAARITTLDSWLKVGYEDARALKFYRDNGNEIIVLDNETQAAVRKMAQEWAEEVGSENEWFKRVYDDQLAFEKLWNESGNFRNIAVE